MKSDHPLVSVVILNYNGIKFIKNCIESLKKQSYKNIEIIFVDNDSKDGSVEFTRKAFKKYNKIKYIINEDNLGFSEGNNIGIRDSKGKYLFILNNDTILDKDCINNLVVFAEKNKNIGIVTPKILRFDKKTIYSAGHIICKNFCFIDRGNWEKDLGQYDNDTEIFGGPATAVLYRREMLEDISFTEHGKRFYFDPDFFMYQEDNDISIRSNLMNWKSMYTSKSVVYHYSGGISGGYNTDFVPYHILRNTYFYILKSACLKQIIKAMPGLFIWEILMFGISIKLKSLFWFKSKIDIIKYFSRMLKKRRIIQSRRKVSCSYINRNMYSSWKFIKYLFYIYKTRSK